MPDPGWDGKQGGGTGKGDKGTSEGQGRGKPLDVNVQAVPLRCCPSKRDRHHPFVALSVPAPSLGHSRRVDPKAKQHDLIRNTLINQIITLLIFLIWFYRPFPTRVAMEDAHATILSLPPASEDASLDANPSIQTTEAAQKMDDGKVHPAFFAVYDGHGGTSSFFLAPPPPSPP